MLNNLEVRQTILPVAKSIAAVLDVEIMIFDNNSNIVGGTVKNNKEYFLGNVYNYIVKTGNPIVIEEPGFHNLCYKCINHNNCFKTAKICYPIRFQDQTIGVLSLVGFTLEHKEKMLHKKNEYLIFLERMSEMVSAKVSEVKKVHELKVAAIEREHILDLVSEGIIEVNETGIVNYFNLAAEKLLRIHRSRVIGRSIKNIMPNFILSNESDEKTGYKKKEIKVYKEDGTEISCYVSTKFLIDNNRNVGEIITLYDAEEIKKMHADYYYNIIQFDDIIGKSEKICNIKKEAAIAAQGPSRILITGESGTGKELFARAIHNSSLVRSGPFVAINCAAIPETLLESELFGYEGGAFTGAKKEGKLGKFELADGGTLFLDEVGDMPLYLQAKLLRVLQEGRIQRLGGTKDIIINVRIISATNKDLIKLVENNRFREDLFFRLNVIPLNIPPLADRKEDIITLINHFLNKYNVLFNKKIISLSKKAEDILINYSWPGNVRELENVIEYSMNMQSGNEITVDNLPNYIINSEAYGHTENKSLQTMVCKFEKNILLEKIKEYGNSLEAKNKIANDLDIGIATLYRKLKVYGID